MSEIVNKVIENVFPNFLLLRAKRSFTNEIIDFEVILSRPSYLEWSNDLDNYRLLYSVKKSLESRKIGSWIKLQEQMILVLENDVVFIANFDSPNREPSEEQISMILGFDGVSHLTNTIVFQRMIAQGLKQFFINHNPFAFGVINIDNYELLASTLDEPRLLNTISQFTQSLKQAINSNDQLISVDTNDFALILYSDGNIEDILPRLIGLSNLSVASINNSEQNPKVEFSAGYVLVTDPYTTVNEILEEAVKMMYKSKNNGENGYQLSQNHHSASDPSR